MNDRTTAPTLAGQRIALRPAGRNDAPVLFELAKDPAVAEMTGRIPHPLAPTDVERWLGGPAPGDDLTEIVFAIERASDGAVLGAIGLILPHGDSRAEVGYWLGRRFWNQGYTTEAVRLVPGYAFGDLALGRVRAGAFPENGASIRVQEKAGMRCVGREMHPAPARGGDREVVIYELTRAEWAR